MIKRVWGVYWTKTAIRLICGSFFSEVSGRSRGGSGIDLLSHAQVLVPKRQIERELGHEAVIAIGFEVQPSLFTEIVTPAPCGSFRYANLVGSIRVLIASNHENSKLDVLGIGDGRRHGGRVGHLVKTGEVDPSVVVGQLGKRRRCVVDPRTNGGQVVTKPLTGDKFPAKPSFDPLTWAEGSRLTL